MFLIDHVYSNILFRFHFKHKFILLSYLFCIFSCILNMQFLPSYLQKTAAVQILHYIFLQKNFLSFDLTLLRLQRAMEFLRIFQAIAWYFGQGLFISFLERFSTPHKQKTQPLRVGFTLIFSVFLRESCSSWGPHGNFKPSISPVRSIACPALRSSVCAASSTEKPVPNPLANTASVVRPLTWKAIIC